ncbi:MAG: polyhydroxyalkanoate depolymerase [Rhodobacteraceae bacterium]|nr:polyhydroxyalkanoate depolymerase [Paracoccaceae bacterium]
MPYYHFYELNHAAMAPVRAVADMTKLYFKNPLNPLSNTEYGRAVAAGCEVLERMTRRYGKPSFDLPETTVGGVRVSVTEQIVWSRPFCDLIHFQRGTNSGSNDPKILIVAPMSGHYATLLRGTVEALLPYADVYITDWIDARMVPLSEGKFDLDDYIDYLISIAHFMGTDTHMIGVCQPSVPVLAAVALMEADNDPYVPASMTLMGGPVDTRVAPTAVNDLAMDHGIEWFKQNAVMKVPFPHAGCMRDVYPGFLQLGGFMSMNLDRHVTAHRDFYQHLVEGDGDGADKHRDFYDEYLAVMDLTAEFYLQTVETVFIEHSLPRGVMYHGDKLVDCSKIERTALMTVEGEKDDITGRGQTKAAHDLCTNLDPIKKVHYEQSNVGHYGVFNGSRWRSEICPRIMDFIQSNRHTEAKTSSFKKTVKSAVAKVVPAKTTKDKPAAKATEPAAADPLAAVLLSKPEGAADDLKAITGIGPKLATTLNEAGIFHYSQIAALTKAQITALDEKLDLRGRIDREDWTKQAKTLVSDLAKAT